MPHPYCSKSWSPPELSSSSGEAGILSTFNLKSTNHFSVHYLKKKHRIMRCFGEPPVGIEPTTY
jgi:hypothetical protein